MELVFLNTTGGRDYENQKVEPAKDDAAGAQEQENCYWPATFTNVNAVVNTAQSKRKAK